MIVGSFGRYTVETAHDHDLGRERRKGWGGLGAGRRGPGWAGASC